jgi:4-hydroxymandelate oxidase
MNTFICSYCNTFVYDEATGDQKTHLDAGTTFDNVPEGWLCPVCSHPKSFWKEISRAEFEEKKPLYDSIFGIPAPIAADSDTSITQIRDKSREMLSGICAVNKVCDGNLDRLCMGIKYGRPIGFGGAGQGRTFDANFKALEKYKFRMRVIKDHKEPSFATKFLGKVIPLPVMVSSVSGTKLSMNDSMPETDFQRGMIEGAKLFGTIGLSGNTVDFPDHPGIEIIKENGGWGIPVFKPQSQERLLKLFKCAEEADVFAIAVDLDGFGSTNWAYRGKPVFRKSEKDLRELVSATSKPVIFKGIMDIEDAKIAVAAGAKAIDISNHGGRVLDYGQGVAEVLPSIVKELKGKVTIMADGAVRTGFDVLKLLALGADIVLIGREMARMSLAGGAKAVAKYLEFMKSDLRLGMLMTGCDTLNEITSKILIKEQ